MRKSITITAAVPLLVVVIAGFMIWQNYSTKQKVELSNLRVYINPQIPTNKTLDERTYFSFTLKNLYSSVLTRIDLQITDLSTNKTYSGGFSTTAIVPNQEIEIPLNVNHSLLSNSTTFNIDLAFDFENGSHQEFHYTLRNGEFKSK